jgi:hypothetical protein
MINSITRANTENIESLFSGKHSFVCAMRYMARKDIKEYYYKLFKTVQEAYNLAPIFNSFIAFKEKELGKTAKDFNELEKYQLLDEFKRIHYKANELLNKGL